MNKKIRVILSDIHGNIEALNAVWQSILINYTPALQEDIEFYILGDLVDYGADNFKVLSFMEYLAERYPIYSIRGNHDDAVLSGDISRFNTIHGKENFKITKQEFDNNQEYYEILKKFTKDVIIEPHKGITLLHGSFDDLLWGNFGPVTPFAHNLSIPRDNSCHLIFGGHTHIQGYKVLNDSIDQIYINPGSVGQPRNGSPLAQFIVIEDDFIIPYSVKYNISSAADKIIKSGRPRFLADRLSLGI